MKKFGMLQKHEDSQNFLLECPDVVCEETANYLVLWCINLEVEEVNLLKVLSTLLLEHSFF